MIAEPLVVQTFQTKRGNTVTAETRPDTTDALTLLACINEDEYGLAERAWTGVAVDVGAHVGGATLALLADNPELHVVAIEALPANVELLRRNVERNGFAERATVIEGAATCKPGMVTVAYGSGATPFESAHRFIGGAVWQDTGPAGQRVEVPGVSLFDLMEQHGPMSLVKIDCEGCEWSFLDDLDIEHVGEIRGEYHPRDGYGPARLRELLEPTHVVTLDDTLDFGPFRAVRR